MFRIAGFVAGSALAVTALLLLLGVQQLATREPIADPKPLYTSPETFVA